MPTSRSLLLGLLLSAVLSAIGTLWPTLPPLLLAIVAVFGLRCLLNPLLRRLRGRRPLSQSELLLLFVMAFAAAALSGSGLTGRLMATAATLHAPGTPQRHADWLYRATRVLPDRLSVGGEGLREAAAAWRQEQEKLDFCTREETQLKLRRKYLEFQLKRHFAAYEQQEAITYQCAPEALSELRRQCDAARLELMNLTRQLNERGAENAAGHEQPSPGAAPEDTQQVSALHQAQQTAENHLAELDGQLEALHAHPLPEELPKLAASKNAIQKLQTQLRQLQPQLDDVAARIHDQQPLTAEAWNRLQALEATAAQPLARTLTAPSGLTFSPCELAARWRAIPWAGWLPPLLCWGLLAAAVLIAFYALALLLIRQWTADSDQATFPLLRLPERLSADQGFSGIWWYGPICGLIFASLWRLLSAMFIWQLLREIPHEWHDALHELAFTPSLMAFALGILIPRRTALATSSTFAAVLGFSAIMTACYEPWHGLHTAADTNVPAISWLGAGAAVVCAVYLLWQARSLLFFVLHPYDLPHARRAERRDLVCSSACFLLGSLTVFLLCRLLFGLTLLQSLGVCAVLLVFAVLAMAVMAVIGLPLFGPAIPPLSIVQATMAWPLSIAPALLLQMFTAMPLRNLAAALSLGAEVRDSRRLRPAAYAATVLLALAVAAVTAVFCTFLFMPRALAYGETACLFNSLTILETLPTCPPLCLHIALGLGAVIAAVLLGIHPRLLPCALAVALCMFPSLRLCWLPLLAGALLAAWTDRRPAPAASRLRGLAIGLLAADILYFYLRA